MEDDIARLLPVDFLRRVPFTRLPHLCRYLKAVRLRAERAALSPAKDRQKADQIQPFQDSLDDLLRKDLPPNSPLRPQIEDLRWMMEELRVSVFAQELGTAYPVSPKRVNEKLEEVRRRGV